MLKSCGNARPCVVVIIVFIIDCVASVQKVCLHCLKATLHKFIANKLKQTNFGTWFVCCLITYMHSLNVHCVSKKFPPLNYL